MRNENSNSKITVDENNDSVKNVNNEGINSANNNANENSNLPNANNENSNSDSKAVVPLATFLELKKQSEKNQKELQKMLEAQEAEKNEKLKENNEWKKLYEDREAEYSRIKMKADKYDAIHNSTVEKAKEVFGDKWKDDMQNLSTETLNDLISVQSVKAPPVDVDNNNNLNDGDQKIILTEDQKSKAYEMFPHRTQKEAELAYYKIKDKIEPKIKVKE